MIKESFKYILARPIEIGPFAICKQGAPNKNDTYHGLMSAFAVLALSRHYDNSSSFYIGKFGSLAASAPLRHEPRCEKTGLRGFRLGPTQTGLYSHRR